MAEVEIFKLFLLVLARVSGLVAAAPILGSNSFPIMGKLGLIGLTALLITPTIAALSHPLPSEPLLFALMGAGEMLIGLSMGFVMTLLFAAIQVGGQVMDMQTGFGMMNIFNPAMETQFPIFGFFLFIVAVLCLLVTGGHRTMLLGLANSFEHIPVGGLVVRPALLLHLSRMGQGLFVDGIMIAAPVAAAMMLAYVIMGLLGRVVPQIQLFVVGFPVTIATSLFLMALLIGVYTQVLNGAFLRMFHDVETLIHEMS